MTIVDSHVHVGLAKYQPVEDLIAVMETHGVAKAVLVQYGGNTDNTYLGECVRRFPGWFATVGIVDTTQPDAVDRLARWVEEEGIGGLRLPVTARSPGADSYAIWARMEALGIVASVTGNLEEMSSPETEEIIRRFPKLKVRLEHMGWYPDVTEEPPYPTYRHFLRLGAYPNVYMMYSAFYGWSRESYPYRDTLPFVRLVYEAFGAGRIMWASDWPPVEEYEGYAKVLAMGLEEIPCDSEEDRAWIMGRTAEVVWGF